MAFGQPLVTNVLRSQIVEAIVDSALPDLWHWCSSDYSSWDFRHSSAVRLEVKQSAARQSWARISKTPSRCLWDIAARSKFWSEEKWIHKHGRNAEIYVLAYHPLLDESADHRDARQWLFFVLRAAQLPITKVFSLREAEKRVSPVAYHDLAAAVEGARTLVLYALADASSNPGVGDA